MFLQKGPNKVPLHAMAVVAVVTVTFIIMGDINFLAPIVTMPFLLTYACIDYSYFALAQTFDIQEQREERFRIQASSPSYESRRFGSATEHHCNNDLDLLFPDRVRHKNLQTPSNSPQHVPFTNNQTNIPTATITNGNVINENSNNYDSITISTTSAATVEAAANNNATSPEMVNQNDDLEPIAPFRPTIHQKTKNWYSGYCNRWASLLGVGLKNFLPLSPINITNIYFIFRQSQNY